MIDITIGANEYRIGKLPPMKQFHVARRLAPLIAALGGAALSLPNDAPAMKPAGDEAPAQESDDKALGTMLKLAQPLLDVISKLSDEDSEYVVNICLGACSRKQGNQFAKVMTANNRLMFEDIELPELMQLTAAVIKENLGNFFREPPAASTSPSATSA